MDLKKTIGFIALLALSVCLVFGYLHISKSNIQLSDKFEVIPINAAVIVSINQFQDLNKKLESTNIIWQALSEENRNSDFYSVLNFIDTNCFSEKSSDLLKPDVLMAVCESGANTYSTLFVLNFNTNESRTYSQQVLLDQVALDFEIVEKKYDELPYFELKPKDENAFKTYIYVVVLGQFLVVTYDIVLVQDVIRQYHTGLNLLLDENLQRLRRTANQKSGMNIFINTATFSKCLKGFFKCDFELNDFSSWIELDGEPKSTALRLNGFMYAPDSSDYKSQLYKNQKPVNIELLNYFPTNTAFVKALGLSNLELYLDNKNDEQLAIWLERQKMDKSSFPGFYQAVFHNQISQVNKEGERVDGISRQILFLKNEKIKKLMAMVKAEEIIEDEVIYSWPYPQMFKVLYGDFIDVLPRFFVRLNEGVVIMAENEFELKDYLGYLYAGRIWEKDISYQKITNQLASKATVFIYASTKNGNGFNKAFLQPKSEKLLNNQSWLNNFDIYLQFAHENEGLYYLNSFLNFDNKQDEQLGASWQITLENNIHVGPFIFTNHYTQNKEFVVQDSTKNLYLISNTGRVIWKKQLTNLIYPAFHIVDKYKNGKFQMLINDKNNLYLLDRNGKDVEGFPLKLGNTEISGPISLMDYDNNRDYRILIPLENGNVANYNIDAQKVSGWDFKSKGAAFLNPFQLLQVKGKDYLINVDTLGNIVALARNGQERLNLKSKLYKMNSFRLQNMGELDKSFLAALNENNNLVKYYLNDKIEEVKFSDNLMDYEFFKANTGKLELIYLFDEFAASADGNEAEFKYDLIDFKPKKLKIIEQLPELTIALTDLEMQLTRLYQIETGRVNELPIQIGKNLKVIDINQNGELEIIGITEKDKISVYSINEVN